MSPPALPPATEKLRANWLFVDLNSYFASVEQETRPELRGQPIGIVPIEARTACVIACSYQAKALWGEDGDARQRGSPALPAP
jgi:DNA polymerase-4